MQNLNAQFAPGEWARHGCSMVLHCCGFAINAFSFGEGFAKVYDQMIFPWLVVLLIQQEIAEADCNVHSRQLKHLLRGRIRWWSCCWIGCRDR